MSMSFATAMRRALEKTCAADPAGATAIIQAALAAGGGDAPCCGPCAKAARAPERATGGGRPLPFAIEGLLSPADVSPLSGHAARLARRASLGPVDALRFKRARRRPAAPTTFSAYERTSSAPDGARIEHRRHAGPCGARDYRLYVPSPREDGLRGLVLMLHGCTQTPEDFAAGTQMDAAAEAAGFAVVYPAQCGLANAQRCWNWFRPGDQVRGRGEAGLLAGLAQEVAEELGLRGRVYAAGLSAGGAMAAVLADSHPEIFSAVGVHSGLPAGAARDVPSAFAAMRGQTEGGRALTVPAIVFHGTADATVSSRNAEALTPGDGVETRGEGGGRRWSHLVTEDGSELWLVDGAGHAWFGGDASGSYADPAGPDASTEILRFFTRIGETS